MPDPKDSGPSPDDGSRSPSAGWGEYLSAGLQFIVPFGAFVALGIWLDTRWGTMPGMTVQGAIVGFVLGLLRLRQLAKGILEEAERHKQRGEQEQPPAGEDRGEAP
jgi:F0F1-type ATP synthase assembly protein I